MRREALHGLERNGRVPNALKLEVSRARENGSWRRFLVAHLARPGHTESVINRSLAIRSVKE